MYASPAVAGAVTPLSSERRTIVASFPGRCVYLRKPRRAIPYFRYTRTSILPSCHSSTLLSFHPAILTAQSLKAHVQTQPLRMRPPVITFTRQMSSVRYQPWPNMSSPTTKSDNSWNGNCRVFLVGRSRAFLASGSEHTINLVALRFLVRAFSSEDAGGRVLLIMSLSSNDHKNS